MAAPRSSLKFACLALLLGALGPAPALAQITPGGLGTRVNGSAFGRCSTGSCAIQGGVKSGANLFHRFGSFDTRHGITDVKLDPRGQGNVILGVVGPEGFFLNTPLRLTSPANLFLLSPRGIWLGSGASFANVPNLLLSTSFALGIGGKRFDVFTASADAVSPLSGSPASPWERPGEAGLTFGGQDAITLAGGLISVDRHLVIDAGPGPIQATGPAATTLRSGQGLRLSGGAVDLSGVALAAGQGRELGPIALEARSGDLRLTASQLLGRQLSLSGQDVAASDSQLRAPDGTIAVKAERELQVVNSQLDVAWSDAYSANAQAGFELPPAIALAAGGRLRLAQTSLNTFTNHQKAGGAPPPRSRSGLVVLQAAQGMALEASTIVADGSTSRAGEIAMVVDGKEGAEGIRIAGSRLSASQGMGGGLITLASSSGIALASSELVAAGDRFPLINGNAYAPLANDGEGAPWRPYGFRGGRITLVNSSTTTPISLANTQLLALQTTSGVFQWLQWWGNRHRLQGRHHHGQRLRDRCLQPG